MSVAQDDARMKLYARIAKSEGALDLRAFIATASCLLALVATQSLHAQSGPATPSDNQKSATSNPPRIEPEAEPVLDAQVPAAPFKPSRWFTRFGAAVAPYHSSATIATNGQPLPGGTAKVSNNMTVTFDVGYELTKNISLSVMSGVPVKPHVTGEGTAAPLGVLGKVRYGPAIFSGYYRFPKIGRFRPYAGGGAAYAIILKEFDGSVKDLKVDNNWGSVVQGGAEYRANSKYTLFFDFKEVWLAVNAHGVLSDGTGVKARVKLNPSMFTFGVKVHFPFGQGH
jgi:outer membrane protein